MDGETFVRRTKCKAYVSYAYFARAYSVLPPASYRVRESCACLFLITLLCLLQKVVSFAVILAV
jgi:hypothetical protein